MTQTSEEKRDERTYAIIGAAMEVHRDLGTGFSRRYIKKRWPVNSPYEEFHFSVSSSWLSFYKGEKLSTSYRADFICFDSVIDRIVEAVLGWVDLH